MRATPSLQCAHRCSTEGTRSASATSVLSAKLLNELHLSLGHHTSDTRALTSGPAVIVFNAFQAGGNQDALSSQHSADGLQLSNAITYTAEKHTFRAGFGLNRA